MVLFLWSTLTNPADQLMEEFKLKQHGPKFTTEALAQLERPGVRWPGFSTSLEYDFLVSEGCQPTPWALCVFCPRKPQCPLPYNAHLCAMTMQIQFLALSLWVSIMLDLNGSSSSVSYQGILVKYLFFQKKKKKNNKNPFWERKRIILLLFLLGRGVVRPEWIMRAGLEVEMSICAWAGYCLSSSTRPRQWERRTPDQHEIQPTSRQCFCRRRRGPPQTGSAGGDRKLLLQGSSVYSNQKADGMDCQGETFLGWTLRLRFAWLTGMASVLP